MGTKISETNISKLDALGNQENNAKGADLSRQVNDMMTNAKAGACPGNNKIGGSEKENDSKKDDAAEKHLNKFELFDSGKDGHTPQTGSKQINVEVGQKPKS
jgi:hypothetical protein